MSISTKFIKFNDCKYNLYIANDLESRQKAYETVYECYLKKGYANNNSFGMWFSIYDALSDTTTLTLQDNIGNIVGTVTLIQDSPLGLPADTLYNKELANLRMSGYRITEIASLCIVVEDRSSIMALTRLMYGLYLSARYVKQLDYFVVTVNPKHVAFYLKKMLFEVIGKEKSYDKVNGAPAVLLSMPLNTPDFIYGKNRERTLFKYCYEKEEEQILVDKLKTMINPMTEEELYYFFIERTNIWTNSTQDQRSHIRSNYINPIIAQEWGLYDNYAYC